MTTNGQAAESFFASVPYTLPKALPIGPVPAAEVRGGLPAGSSPWWVDTLLAEMDARAPRLVTLRRYHRGEQDTWPLHSPAARDAFGDTFLRLKANLAEPIVSAVAQRLKVEGFRVPVQGAADDVAAQRRAAEREAWRIWQANGLDSRSVVAMTEALAMGECPVIVDRDPDDPATPRITVEDPLQVVVHRDPANPLRRLAALKRWREDDGSLVAILYLPDRIEWWRADPRAVRGLGYRRVGGDAFELRGRTWRLDPAESGEPPVPGEVPVVTLVNRPRVDGTGRAEHESVIGLLDALNKTVIDMLTGSDANASPQKTATGVDLSGEDATAPPGSDPATPARPALESGPARVWWTSDPDARFGQLPETTLGAYTAAIDEMVMLVGTTSMTPYHWLLNQTSSVPSTGEALKAAERSLDGKAAFAQVNFGEGLEEAMRLAFLTVGDAAGAAAGIEVAWRPTGFASESQHVDALSKLAAIGVDRETTLELYPFSPEQIERIRERQAAERVATPGQAATYASLVGAGVTPASARLASGIPIEMEHTGLPPVTVQAPRADHA